MKGSSVTFLTSIVSPWYLNGLENSIHSALSLLIVSAATIRSDLPSITSPTIPFHRFMSEPFTFEIKELPLANKFDKNRLPDCLNISVSSIRTILITPGAMLDTVYCSTKHTRKLAWSMEFLLGLSTTSNHDFKAWFTNKSPYFLVDITILKTLLTLLREP